MNLNSRYSLEKRPIIKVKHDNPTALGAGVVSPCQHPMQIGPLHHMMIRSCFYRPSLLGILPSPLPCVVSAPSSPLTTMLPPRRLWLPRARRWRSSRLRSGWRPSVGFDCCTPSTAHHQHMLLSTVLGRAHACVCFGWGGGESFALRWTQVWVRQVRGLNRARHRTGGAVAG